MNNAITAVDADQRVRELTLDELENVLGAAVDAFLRHSPLDWSGPGDELHA